MDVRHEPSNKEGGRVKRLMKLADFFSIGRSEDSRVKYIKNGRISLGKQEERESSEEGESSLK